MKAKEVMTKDVFTCHPETRLSEVAKTMSRQKYGFLPVVDANGTKLLGVLTDRDAFLAASERNEPLSGIDVRDVMKRDVHCCKLEDDVFAVHRTMREHHVRRVPIADEKGRLAGVISLDDLALAAIRRKDEVQQQEVAKTLGAISSPLTLTSN